MNLFQKGIALKISRNFFDQDLMNKYECIHKKYYKQFIVRHEYILGDFERTWHIDSSYNHHALCL